MVVGQIQMVSREVAWKAPDHQFQTICRPEQSQPAVGLLPWVAYFDTAGRVAVSLSAHVPSSAVPSAYPAASAPAWVLAVPVSAVEVEEVPSPEHILGHS